MDELDKMIRSLNLLNETELEALAEVCQARVEGKKKARREALRQELMGNLQKAIGDILHNNFALYIKNTDRDEEDGCEEIYLDTEDIYSIEIEQRFAATLILC